MKWFRHELRVRYQETDQMGVVYHANYMNWFEIGRTELIRSLGMTYREIESRGLRLPLIDLHAEFKGPARYDDRIAVLTQIRDFTPIRMTFASEIRRLDEADSEHSDPEKQEGQLLVSGTTRHVWVNRDWQPVRLDRTHPDLFARLAEWMKS
jgi:acyl-CoA thioester hydrolase